MSTQQASLRTDLQQNLSKIEEATKNQRLEVQQMVQKTQDNLDSRLDSLKLNEDIEKVHQEVNRMFFTWSRKVRLR